MGPQNNSFFGRVTGRVGHLPVWEWRLHQEHIVYFLGETGETYLKEKGEERREKERRGERGEKRE